MWDFHASRNVYASHLLPLYLALDPSERGTFYGTTETVRQLQDAGVTDAVRGRPARDGAGPVVVASFDDHRAAAPRPTVLLQHGVGQRYTTGGGIRHGSYAGGDGRERVVLFLHPSEYAAAPDRARWPDAEHAVIGCPRLDVLLNFRAGNLNLGTPNSSLVEESTVAFAFHADFGRVLKVPELTPALNHYAQVLRDRPWSNRTVGHGHPRQWSRYRRFYESCRDVEPVQDFDQVARQASVFCADNSSTIFEMAALGVPVVVLNAPWFRRDVEHGLRFWEFADVGVQVDEPEELPDALATAILDPPDIRKRRKEIVDILYANLGCASDAAVEALRALAQDRPGLWETRVVESNPYAAKTRAAPKLEPRLPEARLRRLGAPDELVLDARSRFYTLTEPAREEAVKVLAVLPDSLLLSQVREVLDAAD